MKQLFEYPASKSGHAPIIVIGNGFDLHHWNGKKVDTGYESFGCFLRNQKEYQEIFEWLTKTCFLPDNPTYKTKTENTSCWRDFEQSLADFDAMDIVSDYIDDSAPERYGEGLWQAERIVDSVTQQMRSALNAFISGLEYPKDINNVRCTLPEDGLYLSFNYTDTLERYYSINPSQICYIHGKAGTGEELIIGHGVNPQSIEKESPPAAPPLGLTPQQEEMWYNETSSQYSMPWDLVEKEINSYWSKSFKNTGIQLSEHQNFFQQCESKNSVMIFGHSMSEVDLPYFEEIKRRVSSNAYWTVSYHDECKKEYFAGTLSGLGVIKDKITLIRLQDICGAM